MKICILGNAQSIHVQRWSQYFCKKGYQVYLLSPLKDEIGGDAKLYYLKPSCIKVRILSILIEEISYPMQAIQIIRTLKPDILHAFYAEFYGWLGALSQFHPFVISVFGGDVALDPQKGWGIKSKVSCGLKHADVITTQTKDMSRFINQEFQIQSQKIKHIPWGIDLNIFHKGHETEVRQLRRQLNIPDKAPVIISPRQMHPLYQIESIIHAIPEVLKKYPEAIFVFLASLDRADEGQYRDRMIALAQQLKVYENTSFLTSPISQTEMADYLNMADVAVSIPKIDQFGFTVLEAMACGCVPIVNDLECYKEYLKDESNAFIITDSHPQQISKRIIECLENPNIKKRFYSVNQEIVRTSEDWLINAKKMEELYAQLLTESQV